MGAPMAAQAIKEEGLERWFGREDGGGQGCCGMRGGSGGANLLDGGIGDGHIHGVNAADLPEGLGDAEDGEFFGAGLRLVGVNHLTEEPLEIGGRFVTVDGVARQEDVIEAGG